MNNEYQSSNFNDQETMTKYGNNNNFIELENYKLSPVLENNDRIQQNIDFKKDVKNINCMTKGHENNEVMTNGHENNEVMRKRQENNEVMTKDDDKNIINIMDNNIVRYYRLIQMVESPCITFDFMISRTDPYVDKYTLINKCIYHNIFSNNLYFRDIQMVNMMIERIHEGCRECC